MTRMAHIMWLASLAPYIQEAMSRADRLPVEFRTLAPFANPAVRMVG